MAARSTAHDPRVNSDPNADPYEDDGEPWDCDRGFPDGAEEEDDGDSAGSDADGC